jgi:hypothetical protein
MSNADWARVYRSEVRFPSDLLRNGHQYIKAEKPESPALQKAIKRLSEQRIKREDRNIMAVK